MLLCILPRITAPSYLLELVHFSGLPGDALTPCHKFSTLLNHLMKLSWVKFYTVSGFLYVDKPYWGRFWQ